MTSYRWDDEFAGEKTNGGKGTVSNKGQGSEGINNGVYISHSLEPLEAASTATIPERTMPTKEDLDRAKSPTQNLVKPIR